MIAKLKFKKTWNLVLLVTFVTIMIAQAIAGRLMNTFNAGEVSPNIKYRLDLQQYGSACQTLENMIVTPQGAAIRRPGTEFIFVNFICGDYGIGDYGSGNYGECSE